ncbi:MAG: segregation/condensation protein A [Nevskiaceae bacterium]|nr:MAG: segregation/condensation protein A [Nevskiaceae bacterium]TBR74042.1 MAG: segregation/condensation protein A [Nevskiaceae bacterium]
MAEEAVDPQLAGLGSPPLPEHVVKVLGQPLQKLPEDLYIPPDALEVFLEAFEGPLDLLLYLIRKQNLDILDIPVLQITRQYMEYIAMMRGLKLELAAEYLVMAAWLAEIKSRVLLPRPPETEEEGGQDPRLELVRRLQEYERFKTAAERLDALPRVGRDVHLARAAVERIEAEVPLPPLDLRELLMAFQSVMARAELYVHHTIAREPLSVRDRMSRVLDRLQHGPARFIDLFDPAEGRAGIVVALLAVLELVKARLLAVHQQAPFTELVINLPEDTGASLQEPA